MRDTNRSRAQLDALGELRRALYSYSMNSGKTRVTQQGKDKLWERVERAAWALTRASGRS